MRNLDRAALAIPLLTALLVAGSFVYGARRGFDSVSVELLPEDLAHSPSGGGGVAVVRSRHDEDGQGEPRSMPSLAIVIERNGQRVRVPAPTNEDGVAFVVIPRWAVEASGAFHVTAFTGDNPLLFDRTLFMPARASSSPPETALPIIRSSGPLAIRLYTESSELAMGVGSVGAVWVNVRGQGDEGVPFTTLEVHRSDGVRVVAPPRVVSGTRWFKLDVSALAPETLLDLRAVGGAVLGEVQLRLPVLPSGVMPEMPARVPVGGPVRIEGAITGVARTVYAAVRSATGVVAAGACEPMAPLPGSAVPRVSFSVPPLPAGEYWASFGPMPESWNHGIERPFVVADTEHDARLLLADRGSWDDTTPIAACLAQGTRGPELIGTTSDMAGSFARHEERRHARAQILALTAIVLGMFAEGWCLVRRKRRVSV